MFGEWAEEWEWTEPRDNAERAPRIDPLASSSTPWGDRRVSDTVSDTPPGVRHPRGPREASRVTGCVTIVIDARHHKVGKLRCIRALLADYPGEVPARAQVLTEEGAKILEFRERVQPCDALWKEMRALGVVAVPGAVPLPAARP